MPEMFFEKRKKNLCMVAMTLHIQDYFLIHELPQIQLDKVKIGNLKRKNRNHKKVPKQDEDTGNLQIPLHLRSLF